MSWGPTDIWFLLGQVGLFMAATFSIGIIHITAALPIRPPWYYYLTVWLVACACAFVFGEVFTDPENASQLSPAAYLLRFLFGVERMAVYIFYRYKGGTQLSPKAIYAINTWAGGMAVLAMLLMLGYGIYNRVNQLEVETRQTKREVRVKTSQTAEVLLTKLQHRNDSLNTEHLKDRALIASLNLKIDRQDRQIEALLDLVITLEQHVKRISDRVARNSVGVERARRAVSTPPTVLPRQPPATIIDPSRIQKTPH